MRAEEGEGRINRGQAYAAPCHAAQTDLRQSIEAHARLCFASLYRTCHSRLASATSKASIMRSRIGGGGLRAMRSRCWKRRSTFREKSVDHDEPVEVARGRLPPADRKSLSTTKRCWRGTVWFGTATAQTSRWPAVSGNNSEGKGKHLWQRQQAPEVRNRQYCI